jgi:hypothetical protein
VDIATDLALDAPDLFLVHADDGVIRIRLAARARAERLDLAADVLRIIIEE